MGRTGAGKSSLIAMLMRLVEFEGKITKDDVNIQDIGLRNQKCYLYNSTGETGVISITK